MRAFAPIRERRRLAGGIVVALLLLGGIASVHHHQLVAPADGLAFETAAQLEDHGARTVDCVVCRALHPVQSVSGCHPAPPLLVGSSVAERDVEILPVSVARSFPPRAPPVSA